MIDIQRFRAAETACDRVAELDSNVGELIATDGGLQPTRVTLLRVLGHGRAAEARLVEIETADAPPMLCVEKVFRPGLLTRAIYRAAYQSPFGYQDNADAIQASFYRRRIAASLVAAFVPGADVARPLYVRWDDEAKAMVLASVFIRGRGVIPQAVDPKMVRRWFGKRLGNVDRVPDSPPEELPALLAIMQELEQLFLDSGMTGTGWQVCKRAIVSTANLLRMGDRYVVVDLESGIPSILVSTYIRAAFSLRSFPLFDDLDGPRLRDWVSKRRDVITARLSPDEFDQLERDVESLILHTENWKRAEVAIARQPLRLLSRDFRERYKDRVIQSWRRRNQADAETLERVQSSKRFFSRLGFIAGIVPGASGRFLQRIIQHREYRAHLGRLYRDASYRRDTFAKYSHKKCESWRAQGRFVDPQDSRPNTARFAAHWCLSKLAPVWAHRYIANPVYRKNRLTRMGLLCASRRFQSEFGRFILQSRIESWKKANRLQASEADSLTRQLNSPAIDEYVRCFGMHVGLKLLLPLVWSLKVGGAAASVASGNPVYFIVSLMMLPMLRTAVTLYRMLRSGHPASDYRDALWIGMLPMVGSLAYPAQMYAKFPSFSLFLIRDFASQVGKAFPIYGGPDSRTELAAIKLVNLPSEILDVWRAVARFGRSCDSLEQASIAEESSEPIATIPFRKDRWEALAETQLRLLASEAEFRKPAMDSETARETRSEQVSPPLVLPFAHRKAA